MNPDQIQSLNATATGLPPSELLQLVGTAQLPKNGPVIVTTNFRPYESVILHLANEFQPGLPVLWIDHGANLPETYRFAEACRTKMELNLIPSLPRMTAAHWLAINGPNLPAPDEIERVEDFSRIMKIEPFERGMKDLQPAVWITALRREQNLQRAASLQPFQWDDKFGCLKVNPILDWTTSELEDYLSRHNLPNERTYYDPAKGNENHECGLHAKLTTEAN